MIKVWVHPALARFLARKDPRERGRYVAQALLKLERQRELYRPLRYSRRLDFELPPRAEEIVRGYPRSWKIPMYWVVNTAFIVNPKVPRELVRELLEDSELITLRPRFQTKWLRLRPGYKKAMGFWVRAEDVDALDYLLYERELTWPQIIELALDVWERAGRKPLLESVPENAVHKTMKIEEDLDARLQRLAQELGVSKKRVVLSALAALAEELRAEMTARR